MRCIIVEDQPPAQRILKKYIQDVPNLELVDMFSDGLSAMEFLNRESVDIMFLDIHLPKINGLDFLKSIPDPPQVILTTAFSEYALEGYDLNVVDYLLKPFSFQRFLQAVNKANAKLDVQRSGSVNEPLTEIYVKSSHEHIKVLVDDIYTITSDSDYTEIHLEDKKILSNEPLRHWVSVLGGDQFYQIHKSHIINTKKIDRISGNLVILTNGAKVPLGRAYKDTFLKSILK
ncbi:MULTISPECIES: LytTR family DNA-binding domain-containing protein [Flagellimonas]|jgi:DNA-binding LytR/AlgR family response regulator|uniref:DNA-binding response regulator n=1 Tax=Flagellimonas marinaquae TaxID=254955 RepID=A0AA48HYV8_9FLAO|nr:MULTISPECIES: LytTR family DNA-binding domain-containing protein [Allomuricauda]MCA0958445.1 LytTR family DNA-binding domain-containing protein [Allomuricauda ruestringensis]BDW92611.1 DNA-binding response regulator [Allomuricauda aquimarina]